MSVRHFTRALPVPGVSVRLPKVDIRAYDAARKKLRLKTLHKLMGELAACIFRSLESGDKGVVRHGFILEAEKNTEAVKWFRRILKREARTVPNKESHPQWVPLDQDMKKLLAEVATKLHWSEGHTLQESIRAAVFLICEEDAETLPDIFVLYWGRKQFEQRLAEAVNEKKRIEKIKKETRKKETLAVPSPSSEPLNTSLVL
jgi:hypothetical protein